MLPYLTPRRYRSMGFGTDDEIERARDFLLSYKPSLLKAWHTSLDMEA